ncbi:Alpha/beta fold hydrolase [Azospirillaceae bacterium]
MQRVLHRVLNIPNIFLYVCAWICIASSSCFGAEDVIGVVFMHGTMVHPNLSGYQKFQAELESNDFLVDMPEMCWSEDRVFDLSYLDCFRDIDSAVERLKRRGATGIVVGGHSMGGNAAIGYGAHRKGLRGILAVAAAFNPRSAAERPEIAQSVMEAQSLVAQGRGDIATAFATTRPGVVMITATPKVYLSFHGLESSAMIPDNAAKLSAPLFWVAGAYDPSQKCGKGCGFDKAPPHVLNRYVTTNSDHIAVLTDGSDAVLSWLESLKIKK